VWHENEWWFSVVDVVAVLTDSANPRNYWAVLKFRLRDEGANQSITDCKQLKFPSRDGKHYKSDAANTETILRIVQSIPSPKAEPFKQWLAQVGTERLQEEAELTPAEKRLRGNYRRLGYPEAWINSRLESIRTRNAVTGEWGVRGAKQGRQFAVLTDTLSKRSLDITTAEHRQIKGLSSGITCKTQRRC
jgi:DNA-damage-inducible protein D